MAIAFVNGANNGSASNVSTITVTYTPTTGNTVCVFIGFQAVVTNLTVTDNNLNPLQAGPAVTNTIAGACFYYTAAAGATSFIANWTTARACAITVVEYSGVVGGVNAGLAGNTATGNGVSASITVTTQDNNDFVVAGMLGAGNPITTTVGNPRQLNATSGAKLNTSDNTVASAGAVTVTGTLTSALWLIVLLELRSVAGAGGGGSISNWISKAVSSGVNKHG